MERLKLICTLKTHVITDEGDFVPAGTPVQVIGWSEDGPGMPNGKIEVRAGAYMYCDTYEFSEVADGIDTGAVGTGLFLSVPPEALVYSKQTHMAEVRERPAKATR